MSSNVFINKNRFTFASSLSVTTQICMNPKGSCSYGSDIALFGNNVGYEAGRSYKKWTTVSPEVSHLNITFKSEMERQM